MTNLDSILKSRVITLPTKVRLVKARKTTGFSSSHIWMWELDYKESQVQKNWCFWTVVLEKTLENPLDCKEIQPVHSEGDQSWVFFGRTYVEAETPILWPPDVKSWLIWKDPDAGKDWGQEEKGATEDEMAGCHHWLDRRESGWTLGVGDGQGGLACYDLWGCRESDMTEWLRWTELMEFTTYWRKGVNLIGTFTECLKPTNMIKFQMNDQSFAKLKGFISWWPGSWTFYNPYVKEMAKEIWFTQVIWKKKRILKVYCLTYFYEVNTPQSCSKLRKEYIKTVYCHLAYLTSMQNVSCEMLVDDS